MSRCNLRLRSGTRRSRWGGLGLWRSGCGRCRGWLLWSGWLRA
jgi:hypothetical protein